MVVILTTAEIDLGATIGTGNHATQMLRSVTLIRPKNLIPILLLKNFSNTSIVKAEGKRAHVELNQMTMMILIVMEILRTGMKKEEGEYFWLIRQDGRGWKDDNMLSQSHG